MPLIVLWLALVAGIVIWAFRRRRRAFNDVRSALEQQGYRIGRLQNRTLLQGPFWKTTTKSQLVIRLTVYESTGRKRTGWARWGGRWFTDPDILEFKWDD